MVKMKAVLENEDRALWPNQYIQVQLILDTIDEAVLVPREAVQTNSKGKFIFVVKGNHSVEMRQVEVGQLQKDQTIVITKGVKGSGTSGHRRTVQPISRIEDQDC